MRSIIYLALLGVILVTLALVVRSGLLARKDPGRPINSAMREALDQSGTPELSVADANLVREKYPTATRTPSGLLYLIRAPGSGTPARTGDEVIVHYDGRLLDGTPFDSSYRGGTPFTFRVGTGGVIKGWDEAFLSMRKGEKRTLIIPYWLGYGVAGRGAKIPPRATLVFEVELIDIR